MATARTEPPRRGADDDLELLMLRAMLDDDEWNAQSQLLANAAAATNAAAVSTRSISNNSNESAAAKKPDPPAAASFASGSSSSQPPRKSPNANHPPRELSSPSSLQRALRPPKSSLQRALEREHAKAAAAAARELQEHDKRAQQQQQEEQERVHRAKLRRDERRGMLESRAGKAWMFVEEVLKLHASLGSTKKTSTSSRNASSHSRGRNRYGSSTDAVATEPPISPVAIDDMVYMAERMMKAQDSFRSEGRPTHIDIGYHYTEAANLDSIKSTGLMSRNERSGRKIKEAKFHGAVYGEGVYVAKKPDSYHGMYGDIGLIVARLKGVSSVSPQGQKYECDNNCIIKRGSSGEESFIVLQKSSQCVPLIQYSADLIVPHRKDSPGNQTVHEYHVKLQSLIDTYFNNNNNDDRTTCSSKQQTKPRVVTAPAFGGTKKPPQKNGKNGPTTAFNFPSFSANAPFSLSGSQQHGSAPFESGSLFSLSKAPAPSFTASPSLPFGAVPPPRPSFGPPVPGPSFGAAKANTFQFGSLDTTKPAHTSPFSFGQSSVPPFHNPFSAAPSKAQGTSVAPTGTGAFSFGSASSQNNPLPPFGSMSAFSAPPPAPFGFGAAPSDASTQSYQPFASASSGFGPLGGAPTSSTAVFSFGSGQHNPLQPFGSTPASSAPPPALFRFGAAASDAGAHSQQSFPSATFGTQSTAPTTGSTATFSFDQQPSTGASASGTAPAPSTSSFAFGQAAVFSATGNNAGVSLVTGQHPASSSHTTTSTAQSASNNIPPPSFGSSAPPIFGQSPLTKAAG